MIISDIWVAFSLVSCILVLEMNSFLKVGNILMNRKISFGSIYELTQKMNCKFFESVLKFSTV